MLGLPIPWQTTHAGWSTARAYMDHYYRGEYEQHVLHVDAVEKTLKLDDGPLMSFEGTESDLELETGDGLVLATPFGSTIAHGLLTLSMMPVMAYQAMPGVSGTKMGVNYGYNKVRFMAPVKSGKRIRGHFVVQGIEDKSDGRRQITHDVTIEIEGEAKPALVAEWITMVWM